VTVASQPGALRPGRYEARDLVTGGAGPTLRVGPDGRIADYAVAAGMAPRGSLLLDLVRR